MARFLLDTDHLTHLSFRHPGVATRVASQQPGEIAVGIINVEEVVRGRLATIANHSQGGPRHVAACEQFANSFELLRSFPLIRYDLAADTLFQQLRKLKLSIGRQDLRIAAMALVNQMVVVTANTSDFAPIPGLATEDWTI